MSRAGRLRRLPGRRNGQIAEQGPSIRWAARQSLHIWRELARRLNAQLLDTIARDSPEEFQAVRAGKKTVTQARRERKRSAVKQTAGLPTDKCRVLYADPPWKYGNGREALEGTTGASAHYPFMTISELCALPIEELCLSDAVLFLWVTSPLLEEAFPVIRAWGFRYKTSFVWDKVKHNMGHYNSVRHEFLLVCIRGSAFQTIRNCLTPCKASSAPGTARSRKSSGACKSRNFSSPTGRRGVRQSVARLQQASSAAASTLLKIMLDQNTPASTRVRAADSVLDHAAKAIELEDIESRVAVLEEAAERVRQTR